MCAGSLALIGNFWRGGGILILILIRIYGQITTTFKISEGVYLPNPISYSSLRGSSPMAEGIHPQTVSLSPSLELLKTLLCAHYIKIDSHIIIVNQEFIMCHAHKWHREIDGENGFIVKRRF